MEKFNDFTVYLLCLVIFALLIWQAWLWNKIERTHQKLQDLQKLQQELLVSFSRFQNCDGRARV